MRLHAFRKINFGSVGAIIHKLIGSITQENRTSHLARLKLGKEEIQCRSAVRFYASRERTYVNEEVGFENHEFAPVNDVHTHAFLHKFQGFCVRLYENLACIILKQKRKGVIPHPFFHQSARHFELLYGRSDFGWFGCLISAVALL